ncbi:MAG: NAD-dependent epimerase/dehydratase family protein, partial [Desulfobacteraceae bacterium]|nr:NAD-dependent epimerase/dehydratase family protein [Desulfobacteraceae bacterium]
MFTKSGKSRYRKIVVTGGTGLVGSALQSIADEYRPTEFIFSGSKDCNLVIAGEVNDYIRTIEPDAIIHLAANCGGIGLSMNQQATTLRDNVLMNINILEAARLNEVKKTVMSLSTGMYPA